VWADRDTDREEQREIAEYGVTGLGEHLRHRVVRRRAEPARDLGLTETKEESGHRKTGDRHEKAAADALKDIERGAAAPTGGTDRYRFCGHVYSKADEDRLCSGLFPGIGDGRYGPGKRDPDLVPVGAVDRDGVRHEGLPGV
jgi:hypothetical protein